MTKHRTHEVIVRMEFRGQIETAEGEDPDDALEDLSYEDVWNDSSNFILEESSKTITKSWDSPYDDDDAEEEGE